MKITVLTLAIILTLVTATGRADQCTHSPGPNTICLPMWGNISTPVYPDCYTMSCTGQKDNYTWSTASHTFIVTFVYTVPSSCTRTRAVPDTVNRVCTQAFLDQAVYEVSCQNYSTTGACD